MLGVLAVMGILSVAGVKAYTYAMNRHRANELIYETNKRATSVAMQIAAGRNMNDLSISDFPNPAGYTLGVEPNPSNANQFNITITGVNSDICTQMKTMMGTDTAIRLISQFCDKLTFNNDLSKTVYASDAQTETACAASGNTWCGGTGVCSDIGCCDGQAELPPCQTCNAGAIVSAPMEGKACDYDGNGTQGMCHVGKCDPLPPNVSCDSEANCSCTNGGQLCNRATGLCCAPHDGSILSELCNTNGDINTTDETKEAKCITLSGNCSTNADCSGDTPWCKITESTGCRTPKKGVCTEITSNATSPIAATIYGLGEVIASRQGMNWWSAKNWCEANGKHLIDIEAFQAYVSGTETLVTAKTGYLKAGCAKGKTCDRWSSPLPANAMWKSNGGADASVLTNARNENGELYSSTYSPIVLSLGIAFRTSKNVFWTASDDGSVDSCNAITVNPDSAAIHHFSRSQTSARYALCH